MRLFARCCGLGVMLLSCCVAGCDYVSTHGDARLFHTSDFPKPTDDELSLGPSSVNSTGTYTFHVRRLPIAGTPYFPYPTIIRLDTNDYDTPLRDDRDYVAARKQSTGIDIGTPAWRNVQLRYTLRAPDGTVLFKDIVDFGDADSAQFIAPRGWRATCTLQFPRKIPIYDSYDLTLEVLRPSSYPGDRVSLVAYWGSGEREKAQQLAARAATRPDLRGYLPHPTP